MTDSKRARKSAFHRGGGKDPSPASQSLTKTRTERSEDLDEGALRAGRRAVRSVVRDHPEGVIAWRTQVVRRLRDAEHVATAHDGARERKLDITLIVVEVMGQGRRAKEYDLRDG